MFFWNPLVPLVFLQSSGCWPFDLWFLCLFKSSLNIWKFLVHILLKPGLRVLSIVLLAWDECSCAVVWASLALLFFEIRMKTDLFQSCGHCWVFQVCWHIECSTFTASFRIWRSAAGIPSLPLTLFVVMLPKAHLTSHSRMSGSSWVMTVRTSRCSSWI